MTAKLHDSPVRDRRGRMARLLDKVWHRHYPVRRTWTLDGSPWGADPNALDHCVCGATRSLWGPSSWVR